jgi:hypothetical protein
MGGAWWCVQVDEFAAFVLHVECLVRVLWVKRRVCVCGVAVGVVCEVAIFKKSEVRRKEFLALRHVQGYG